MADDEWRLRDRLLLGLHPTGLALVIAGALCFTGYLVDQYLVPVVANPMAVFFGIGGILAGSGFVLIGLHTFFASRTLWAQDHRQESIAQFTYLIGLTCGVTGGFLLTGLASDIGGGIQFVLVAVAGFQSEEFSIDTIYIAHMIGAVLTFYPTLWGTLSMSLYNPGLALWILGLFAIWTRNPRLGFQFQFQKPP